MVEYKYIASDVKGKEVKGTLNAANMDALKEQLRSQGLFLLDVDDVEREPELIKLKTKELADFCRQLYAMLSAGVSLIKALGILMSQDEKPRVIKIYTALYQSLQRGNSLSDAMEQMNGTFPPLLVGTFRASENSGSLDKAAERMALHYEREARLNQKIKSASFYPKFLMGLVVVVVVIIFTVVLPKFFKMFDGMELPLPTRIMLAISNGLRNHWIIILIAVLLLILATKIIFSLPPVRLWRDKIKLRLPMIGKLMKTIYTARFAMTLSSLYSSGLTILAALQNCRDTIGNDYIASQFDQVIHDVRNGDPLWLSLTRVEGFNVKLTGTVRIGEETGRLDSMLSSIANTLDYESEQAIGRLTSILEPVLIIVLAGVIGFIMISVLMPILTMYNTIGVGAGSI